MVECLICKTVKVIRLGTHKRCGGTVWRCEEVAHHRFCTECQRSELSMGEVR